MGPGSGGGRGPGGASGRDEEGATSRLVGWIQPALRGQAGAGLGASGPRPAAPCRRWQEGHRAPPVWETRAGRAEPASLRSRSPLRRGAAGVTRQTPPWRLRTRTPLSNPETRVLAASRKLQPRLDPKTRRKLNLGPDFQSLRCDRVQVQ